MADQAEQHADDVRAGAKAQSHGLATESDASKLPDCEFIPAPSADAVHRCERCDEGIVADRLVEAVWNILDETGGSEAWVHDLVHNALLSWRAARRSQGRLTDGLEVGHDPQ